MISVCFNRFLMVSDPLIPDFCKQKKSQATRAAKVCRLFPSFSSFARVPRLRKEKDIAKDEGKIKIETPVEKWRKRHDSNYRETYWCCTFLKMDHMIVHTWILQQLWCTQGNGAKLIADAQIPVLIFGRQLQADAGCRDASGEVVKNHWKMNGTHRHTIPFVYWWICIIHPFVITNIHDYTCIYISHTHICI